MFKETDHYESSGSRKADRRNTVSASLLGMSLLGRLWWAMEGLRCVVSRMAEVAVRRTKSRARGSNVVTKEILSSWIHFDVIGTGDHECRCTRAQSPSMVQELLEMDIKRVVVCL